MLRLLKKWSLPLIIGIVLNVGFFTELDDFVSLGDIAIIGTIMVLFDLGLIGLMIRDYLKNR